jgi:hypothetical protein
MQQLLSESVQASVRPHECFDNYYADPKNSKVQCFPSTVENRFVTALPSLASGSTSTITFNPDGAVSDIIVTAQLPLPAAPVAGGNAGDGLGLTRGWLYQMVQSISIRYAGSSLYFFGGEQELIECLAECEDSVKRDNLLAVGGAELRSYQDWAIPSLRQASIYIKLPHNSPSAQEKPIAMCTDVFSAPMQVQIQWKPFSSVVVANAITGAGTAATLAQVQATIPTQFSSAQMQFKQAHLADRSDGAAVREDLSKHALSIPLKNFMQFQFTASLPSQASSIYQVNLTGFRSGSVQGIMLWAVANSSLSSVTAKNPLQYIPLQAVTLSVNGLVYFQSQNGNSQLWNLVEKKCASQASTTALTWNSTTSVYDATGIASYWTWVPFAQGVETLRDESALSNGLGIANSVVSLQVDTGLASTDCTLYASYLYNCTFLASGGSGDYVF